MQKILGFILNLFGGGLGKLAVDALLVSQKQKLDAKNDSDRIAAEQNVAFWERQVQETVAANKEGTARQGLKMNHAVFWFILGAALFPGLFTFILLTIYNVLWHANGVWPQQWGIAAFPEPYNQWAQMSIEWVFDPIKLAMSTGVATAGGYLTGRKVAK